MHRPNSLKTSSSLPVNSDLNYQYQTKIHLLKAPIAPVLLLNKKLISFNNFLIGLQGNYLQIIKCQKDIWQSFYPNCLQLEWMNGESWNNISSYFCNRNVSV